MAGPDPAVATVRSAVRRAVADLDPGDLVLVACSGGQDSLALAAGAAFVLPRSELRAGGVVIDHGWRPDSAQVVAGAARTCRELGLDPVETVAVDAVARPGGDGPEATARTARYRALEAAAVRHGAAAVLLGHTRDDQAETVLLGLARGSGARSLAGMPARRGPFRRPLLGLPRSATGAACSALGLRPWHDPANGDPAYARSRLRSALRTLEEALGPGLTDALARSADLLGEDAEALDALATRLLEDALVGTDPPALDTAVLAEAPDAVRRRALLATARRAGCPAGALARRHVLAMDALVIRWRGQGAVHLPGGVGAVRDCGRLLFAGRGDVPRGQGRERRGGQ